MPGRPDLLARGPAQIIPGDLLCLRLGPVGEQHPVHHHVGRGVHRELETGVAGDRGRRDLVAADAENVDLAVRALPFLGARRADQGIGHPRARGLEIRRDVAEPGLELLPRRSEARRVVADQRVREQQRLDPGGLGRLQDRNGGGFLVRQDEEVRLVGACHHAEAKLLHGAVISLAGQHLDMRVELAARGLHGLRDHVPIDLAGLAGVDEDDVETLRVGRNGAAKRHEERRRPCPQRAISAKLPSFVSPSRIGSETGPRPLTFGKVRPGAAA